MKFVNKEDDNLGVGFRTVMSMIPEREIEFPKAVASAIITASSKVLTYQRMDECLPWLMFGSSKVDDSLKGEG